MHVLVSHVLEETRQVDFLLVVSAQSGPGALPDNGDDRQCKAPAPERVTMDDLRNGRAQQILLRDGDTVNVPKAQTFIVNGFVRTPNTYVLEGEITVQKAIAMAGGVTERGAVSRTKIQRMVDGRLVEIKAKLTDIVQPNDTIVVPQRFF